MDIDIRPISMANMWLVQARGNGDHGRLRESIHWGALREDAERRCLEVEALARLFPHGPDGEADDGCPCATLVAPLFQGRETDLCAPFAWARAGWATFHRDGLEFEAALDEAELFWFDEHGAKRVADISWSPRERAFLASLEPVARMEDAPSVHALVAGIDALILRSEIKDPGRAGGAPSL